MTASAELTTDELKEWRKKFYSEPKNVLAQNVCTRIDPFEACLSRQAIEKINHVFTYKIETEAKPVTNQKNSGRCWLFAALNCIRIPFMKRYELDEFEFSQSYLFFWDKIERCNHFLHNIYKTAAKEPVEGRLVSFLLSDPICDGGQWDMFVNLVTKHGLMPKKCFPESFTSEATPKMNAILKTKLREYAKEIRELVHSNQSESTVLEKIKQQMKTIYKIVGICLGIPPETFTWEYYNKTKHYHSIGPMTACDFYKDCVKPVFDVTDKVCLVTDPRPTNRYSQAYTVDYLNNVVGGRDVLYNNQPVELLMDLVVKSVRSGDPVWFGCEVSKRYAPKYGAEDLEIHDFPLVFDTDIQVTMPKADRLIYGESAMTHAMVFTAASVNDKDEPYKFRVENSWGEEKGDKGYLVMTTGWFKEFLFEIVVDKHIVPQKVLDVFKQTPIVLPAWDPMGTLAN